MNEKLAHDFLVERKRADIPLHSHTVGIYIHDSFMRNTAWMEKITDYAKVPTCSLSVIDSILSQLFSSRENYVTQGFMKPPDFRPSLTRGHDNTA